METLDQKSKKLFKAIVDNTAVALELLEDKEIKNNINMTDDTDITYLDNAIMLGNEEVVNKLLKIRDLDVEDTDHLAFATLFRRTNIVLPLLEAGAEICTEHLTIASFLGQTKILEMMLDKYPELINGEVQNENNTRFSLSDWGDVTPLYCATMGGHMDTVQMLVERGADLYITHNGKTAYDVALTCNLANIATYLKSKMKNVKVKEVTHPVNYEDIAGRVAKLEIHSNQQGINMNEQKMAMSVEDDDIRFEIIIYLIILCSSDNEELKEVINKLPTKPDIDDECFFSFATRSNRINIVRLFLEAGGQIPTVTGLITAFIGLTKILEMMLDKYPELINKKVEINTIDSDDASATLLYCATLCGHMGTVEMLVERGADLYITNNGKTAYDVALTRNHANIATYLKSKMDNLTVKEVAKPVNEDIADRVAKLEIQCNQQGTEINRQKTEINQQKTEINQQKTEIIQQKTEINQQKTEINQQKNEINQHKTEINQHKTEINQQKTEIEDLKRENTELTVRVTKLEGNVQLKAYSTGDTYSKDTNDRGNNNRDNSSRELKRLQKTMRITHVHSMNYMNVSVRHQLYGMELLKRKEYEEVTQRMENKGSTDACEYLLKVLTRSLNAAERFKMFLSALDNDQQKELKNKYEAAYNSLA